MDPSLLFRADFFFIGVLAPEQFRVEGSGKRDQEEENHEKEILQPQAHFFQRFFGRAWVIHFYSDTEKSCFSLDWNELISEKIVLSVEISLPARSSRAME